MGYDLTHLGYEAMHCSGGAKHRVLGKFQAHCVHAYRLDCMISDFEDDCQPGPILYKTAGIPTLPAL